MVKEIVFHPMELKHEHQYVSLCMDYEIACSFAACVCACSGVRMWLYERVCVCVCVQACRRACMRVCVCVFRYNSRGLILTRANNLSFDQHCALFSCLLYVTVQNSTFALHCYYNNRVGTHCCIHNVENVSGKLAIGNKVLTLSTYLYSYPLLHCHASNRPSTTMKAIAEVLNTTCD